MAEAEAPGKLVVCGEYAVLADAPAIAVAVDVRARARVAAGGEGCRLEVADEGSWAFRWDARGLPDWETQPGHGRGLVLGAVAATLADAGLAVREDLSITLDTRAFHVPGGGKLGLGSSAAIIVALIAALCAEAGRPLARHTVFELAQIAHRRLQAGSGSGIDIAAAVHGGVVGLVPGEEVAVLGWPTGLHWFAAWSGYGAATMPLLRRFNAYRRRQARSAAGAGPLDQLCEVARAAYAAWQQADAATILRTLEIYGEALNILDATARIGIATRAHRRMAAMAAELGCVYKTSGAGGGDFGLVLSDDAAVIGHAAREFAAAGIRVLEGGAGVAGLQTR